MKKKHMETALIHHGYKPEEHKGSLTPPLFQTSTFTFETARKERRVLREWIHLIFTHGLEIQL